MLICARCDSGIIITDYETIPGSPGRHPYPKCFKCGSRIVKEENMGAANTGKCSKCGTGEAVAGFLCEGCFLDSHGISVQEYRDNKRHRTETPASVSARLKGEPETKQPKPETKAAEKETKPVKSKTKLPAYEAQPVGEENVAAAVVLPIELYEKIVQLAHDEFRPVDMQVQYLIHKGLQSV